MLLWDIKEAVHKSDILILDETFFLQAMLQSNVTNNSETLDRTLPTWTFWKLRFKNTTTLNYFDIYCL